MYKIIACSKYGREEVDTAESAEEAAFLVREYAVAFGRDFSLYALNEAEALQAGI